MSTDLEGNYAGAFANKIGFGKKPALILVDFVRAYFDKDCGLFADVESELASALRIRDVARSADIDIPIIYSNVVYNDSGADGGRFFEKVLPLQNFTRGSAMGAWAEGINPANNELVVSRQYPD